MTDEQRSILRAFGYTDEQIEAMSTLQREAEVEDAIAAGVKPSGDTDSAEPEIQVRGKNKDLQWPLWPFALAAAVTLSGFYWLYAPEPEKRMPAPARVEVPGWRALSDCMSLTSFDSVRELSLESDHSVTMTTERRASEKPDVARGTWACGRYKAAFRGRAHYIYRRNSFVRTNVGSQRDQRAPRTFTHFTSLSPEHGPTQAKNKSVQPRFQHMQRGT